MTSNEFLATELMGWRVVPNHTQYGIRATYEDSDGKYLTLCGDWNPFKNISHAFEVVEKMRERGFHFQLNIHSKNRVFNCATFFDNKDENVKFTEFNKNPATAITLAACKALKGEVDE